MRLAIFGYPRSGTTYLYDIIRSYLMHCGELEHHQSLYEGFKPNTYSYLAEKKNSENELVLEIQSVDRSWMTRETRFDLIKKFSERGQDYFIKMLSGDTEDVRILPWMIQNYPIVTICRRNHFDAYISWLVAWQHRIWNRTTSEVLPEYSAFDVDPVAMHYAIRHFRGYFDYVSTIPEKTHIYYEDMIAMSPKKVLQQIGIYQPGFEAKPPTYIKLMELSDKLKLINNTTEVIRYYTTFIKPMTEK
jgi:hypothetical protein